MYWISVHPDSIAYFKEKKANKVKTLEGGVEVWKDAYGYFRLIHESAYGDIRISSGDLLSLERAEEVAAQMPA